MPISNMAPYSTEEVQYYQWLFASCDLDHDACHVCGADGHTARRCAAFTTPPARGVGLSLATTGELAVDCTAG